jgi:hypothetical protein
VDEWQVLMELRLAPCATVARKGMVQPNAYFTFCLPEWECAGRCLRGASVAQSLVVFGCEARCSKAIQFDDRNEAGCA